MAWAKCWSSPTERTHSGPWCSGLGLHPNLFSCFGSSGRLIHSMSLRWVFHSLFSLQYFFFSFCICTRIFRGALYSIKEKRIPHRTKPFRAADLIVQFSKFWIIKQGHMYSQAQFSTRFGEKKDNDKARLQDDSVYVGSQCHPDLKNIKSAAVVIWSQIVARFVLRLIRLACTDYSWTIRSLQLADTTDNNA